MIIKRQGRKGLILTSSYFDDIKMLHKDRQDTRSTFNKHTSYQTRQKTGGMFDEMALNLAWSVQEITCWKRGCAELSAYVNKLSPKALAEVEDVRYYGEYVKPLMITVEDPVEGTVTREMTDEEFDAAYKNGDFFVNDEDWAKIKAQYGMK